MLQYVSKTMNFYSKIYQSSRPYIWSFIVLSTVAVSTYLSQFNPELSVASSISITVILCLLASAFFIHNDILDRDIDAINNRYRLSSLSQKELGVAGRIYLTMVLLALVIALSHSWTLALETGAVIILLYSYNVYLRKYLLISNVVSAVCSLSPLWFFYFFDLKGFNTLWPFLLSALLLLTSREIIFDIKDIDGDRCSNRKTLPMLIGNRASLCFSIMGVLISVINFYYWAFSLYGERLEIYISFILVCFVSFYLGLKHFNASNIYSATAVVHSARISYFLMAQSLILVTYFALV